MHVPAGAGSRLGFHFRDKVAAPKRRTSNVELPTSNFQHPTSNIQLAAKHRSVPCSMLGIGCWMLDVFLFFGCTVVPREIIPVEYSCQLPCSAFGCAHGGTASDSCRSGRLPSLGTLALSADWCAGLHAQHLRPARRQ